MLACVSMFPLDTYYHSACALIHVVFNGVIGVIVKFRVRFQSVTLNCILSHIHRSQDSDQISRLRPFQLLPRSSFFFSSAFFATVQFSVFNLDQIWNFSKVPLENFCRLGSQSFLPFLPDPASPKNFHCFINLLETFQVPNRLRCRYPNPNEY